MLISSRAVSSKIIEMKLPPTEAALLVNVKIYMTRADEILSDKGIMMLSKITQLQNLLCRMARVTPESLDRVLAGPLEIIKFDKERREMEAQEQREEVARQRAANGEESGDEYVPIKSSKKRRATGGHEALKTPTKVNSGASNYVVDDDSDDVDSTLDGKSHKAFPRTSRLLTGKQQASRLWWETYSLTRNLRAPLTHP